MEREKVGHQQIEIRQQEVQAVIGVIASGSALCREEQVASDTKNSESPPLASTLQDVWICVHATCGRKETGKAPSPGLADHSISAGLTSAGRAPGSLDSPPPVQISALFVSPTLQRTQGIPST